MDGNRRALLTERRELNRLRLVRSRESANFRALAPLLCEGRLHFSKIPVPAVKPLVSHLRAVEGRDERVYWPRVKVAHCATWADASECRDLLSGALMGLAHPDERIGLIFHPVECGLSIESRALTEVWPKIHDRLYETIWIAGRKPADWLIEISYLDRELCYAARLVGTEAPEAV